MSWIREWPTSPDVNLGVGKAHVLYRLRGSRLEVDVRDMAGIPFEDCDPVRDFPTWPRKRHYSGRFFMQSTRTHVPFESLVERSFLIEHKIAGRCCRR